MTRHTDMKTSPNQALEPTETSSCRGSITQGASRVASCLRGSVQRSPMRHIAHLGLALAVVSALALVFPSLSAEDGAASSAHCPVCGAEDGSRPDRALAADSIDSRLKAFHHYGIDAHAEGYLVCVFDAVRTGGAKQEVLIHATIVAPIRGVQRTGDRLTFTRVSDSEVADVCQMRGGLYFVFLGRSADADSTVDPQDPNAFWEYSSELSRVVELHRIWANQALEPTETSSCRGSIIKGASRVSPCLRGSVQRSA
jgi:hypothetical protein